MTGCRNCGYEISMQLVIDRPTCRDQERTGHVARLRMQMAKDRGRRIEAQWDMHAIQ